MKTTVTITREPVAEEEPHEEVDEEPPEDDDNDDKSRSVPRGKPRRR